MTTIVTRAGKGTPLTWNEGDANFNNLNAAVIAAQTTADSALVAATTTFTGVAIGVVPASGGGTANYLRADGVFAAPPGAGVTPGGADTQVQFNDGGAFGGDADFTWNKTTNLLSIAGREIVVGPNSVSEALVVTQGVHASSWAQSWYSTGSAQFMDLTLGASFCDFDTNVGYRFYADSGQLKYTIGSNGKHTYAAATADNTMVINGAASQIAVQIVQGATAGTGLQVIDSTAAGYIAVQPGATDNFITTNKPLTIYSATDEMTTFSGGVTIEGASIPQNSQSVAYTLVATDANKHILHPSADTSARTFTIPANASVAYAVGTALTFVNQVSAGTVTIAVNSDVMRLAGAGTTGSRTLAANGIATALKIAATEWIISGTGLT